jgi:hypothetical protein
VAADSRLSGYEPGLAAALRERAQLSVFPGLPRAATETKVVDDWEKLREAVRNAPKLDDDPWARELTQRIGDTHLLAWLIGPHMHLSPADAEKTAVEILSKHW